MAENFNLWEFYALCEGDLSIENVNTAVALINESCAYRALKHVRTRHICPRNTAWGDGEITESVTRNI